MQSAQLENFQCSDYHQLRLPDTFFFFFFILDFWWIVETFRLSSITNWLMRENCFGCDLGNLVSWGRGGGFQHETVASVDTNHRKCQTPTPPPPPLTTPPPPSPSLLASSFTTAPHLINDTANVTSNRKTLCTGDNYATAQCDKLLHSAAAVEGSKGGDYVIDIYLDRMKVL